MEAVEGEDHHHDEVRDEDADVEAVPAVLAAEGAVGVVSAPVVREAVLTGKQNGGERVRMGDQRWRLPGEWAGPILREQKTAMPGACDCVRASES
jgi:hypothetical protein